MIFANKHPTDMFAAQLLDRFEKDATKMYNTEALRAGEKLKADYEASNKPEFFGFASRWIEQNGGQYQSLGLLKELFYDPTLTCSGSEIELSDIKGNPADGASLNDLAIRSGF